MTGTTRLVKEGESSAHFSSTSERLSPRNPAITAPPSAPNSIAYNGTESGSGSGEFAPPSPPPPEESWDPVAVKAVRQFLMHICLDEAQMIESTQAKTAEMALR